MTSVGLPPNLIPGPDNPRRCERCRQPVTTADPEKTAMIGHQCWHKPHCWDRHLEEAEHNGRVNRMNRRWRGRR